MKRIDIGFWYVLAQTLREWRDHRPPEGRPQPLDYGSPVDRTWAACFLAARRAQHALERIDTTGVDLGAARNAYDDLRKVSRVSGMDREAHDNAMSALDRFERVLLEQLADTDVFVVGPKGLFSTRMLVELADRELSQQVRNVVDKSALEDLRAAGRCLAFECATACGYHAMRATEAVLRQWSEVLTGDSPGNATWGRLERDLEKVVKERGGYEATRLAFMTLKTAREKARNPVAHPREFLEVEDARSFFKTATLAIELMVAHIEAGGIASEELDPTL